MPSLPDLPWDDLERRVRRLASLSRIHKVLQREDQERVIGEVLADLRQPDTMSHWRTLRWPEDYVRRRVRRAAVEILRAKSRRPFRKPDPAS